MKIKNKTAQVTMWVIMGILIVAMILLFLYFKNQSESRMGGKSESNLISVFESCLEEKVKETIKTISEQGGYLNNTLNITFQFKDSSKIQEISYLCFTTQGYFPCINQEPLLMGHLEKEIETSISAQVRMCFDEATSSLERQGGVVEARYNGFDIEIVPRKIIVNVNGEITSTKSGKTTKQTEIRGMFSSRLYEITRVVQEIVNQEATYCNFDLLGFMLFYPQFQIDKAMTRLSTTIYTVKHEKGVEKFDFAIRSCSFPPGF